MTDCIGIRLLRREIRELEIRLQSYAARDAGKTICAIKDKQLLKEKIKELESLGYKYIEGWDD